MKKAIIDASVVLKWYLPDEEHGSRAMDLLVQYVSGDLTLLAPSLLEYEVLSGLAIAHRRGRVGEDNLIEAVSGFEGLGLELMGLSGIYETVVRYCNRYGCSAYDASYLALSSENNLPFITADERLYSLVAKDMKGVKWLGDV